MGFSLAVFYIGNGPDTNRKAMLPSEQIPTKNIESIIYNAENMP